MTAENPETQGAQPAAPAGVNQELPSVDVARQNFREKVQTFVDTVKKYEEHPEQGPTSDVYHKLQGFLNNTTLPKRNQEKEIVNAMTVLASQLEKKKQVVDNMEAAAFQEMSQKFKGIIKEAGTAEEEFDTAYEENQKQANKKQPPSMIVPFVDVLDANQQTQTLFVEKDSVMATSNTREGFQAAAKHFAESKDANGNSRMWSNVNLVHPKVTAPDLQASAGLKDNVHQQLLDTLKEGLYPENDIKTWMEAASRPSLNSRAHFLTDKPNVISKLLGYQTEREKITQQIQQLRDAIGDYKEARDNAMKGIAPKESGVQASVDVVNKNKQAPDKSTPKDNSNENSNEQAASLTMKPGSST